MTPTALSRLLLGFGTTASVVRLLLSGLRADSIADRYHSVYETAARMKAAVQMWLSTICKLPVHSLLDLSLIHI